MVPVPLTIDGEVRVVTAHSVWLVRADAYCRLPRAEAPRPASSTALIDGIWHAHEGAWLVTDDALGPCLRLLPAGRPHGASGILTGAILTCEPALEELRKLSDTD